MRAKVAVEILLKAQSCSELHASEQLAAAVKVLNEGPRSRALSCLFDNIVRGRNIAVVWHAPNRDRSLLR